VTLYNAAGTILQQSNQTVSPGQPKTIEFAAAEPFQAVSYYTEQGYGIPDEGGLATTYGNAGPTVMSGSATQNDPAPVLPTMQPTTTPAQTPYTERPQNIVIEQADVVDAVDRAHGDAVAQGNQVLGALGGIRDSIDALQGVTTPSGTQPASQGWVSSLTGSIDSFKTAFNSFQLKTGFGSVSKNNNYQFPVTLPQVGQVTINLTPYSSVITVVRVICLAILGAGFFILSMRTIKEGFA
jgi:hypothetical protein